MEAQESTKPPSIRAAAASVALATAAAGALALGMVSSSPVRAAAPPAATPHLPAADPIVTFAAPDPHDLARVLDALWDETAADGAVPNVAPGSLPEGMEYLATPQRKRTFFRSVLPYILQGNQRVARDREVLLAALGRAKEGLALGDEEAAALRDVLQRYRLDEMKGWDLENDRVASLEAALERVDVIPPSLALAQAALESGWGSSRFLKLGNALFGQWVFSAEKGVAPRERPKGAKYSVARFDHLANAVAAYMKNLNTLWAYEDFRKARARARRAKTRLDAHELAEGLILYSQRREVYVDEIHRVIRGNRLTRFDRVHLRKVSVRRLARILSDEGGMTSLGLVRLPDPDA